MAVGKRIEELEVFEVSLVTSPANRRRFAIKKNKGGEEMDFDSVWSEILKMDLENEDKVDEWLEKRELSEKGKQAVKATLKTLLAYKDELPNDVINMLAKLSGMEDVKKPEHEDEKKKKEVKKEEKKEEKTEEVKKEGVSKMDLKNKMTKADLEKVPEEVRDVLESIWKERDDLKEMMVKQENEKKEREFIQKAKDEYSDLPMKAEEFGKLLKQLNDKAPDELKVLEGLLKSLNVSVEKSDLFKEVGSNMNNESVGDSWLQIEKLAESYVQKDEFGMTKEMAIAQVIQDNPKLYTSYMNELNG